MSNSRQARQVLFISCIVYFALTLCLFVFSPIPPVGIVGAFALAFVGSINLFCVLFPKPCARLKKLGDQALEKEPKNVHLGNYLP